MADDGPDGYYEMNAEEWCDWACSQARLLRAEIQSLRNSVYRETLRTEQFNAVMPLIGPLLDSFDGIPNDMRSELQEQCASFYDAMQALVKEVGNG